MIDELMAEAVWVAAQFSPLRLLILLGLVALAVLSTRAVQAGVAQIWRMGLDRRRRLAAARRGFDLTLVVVLLSLLVNRILTAAPVMGGLVLIFAAAGALWLFAGSLRNLAAGLSIVLRGRIHEGDHVVFGTVRGTVQEIGLTRLVLIGPKGATIYVPCRVVESEISSVRRARPEVPVVVRLALLDGNWPGVADELHAAASLSPWRVPDTAVGVLADDEGGLVEIEIQTWTEAAVRSAQAQLMASAAAVLRLSAPAATGSDRPGPATNCSGG